MTAQVVSAPTTSWDIKVKCDGKACDRSVTLTLHAVSQAAAMQHARAHVRKNDGWTSKPVPVGDGRARGYNTADLCRGCANQKAVRR